MRILRVALLLPGLWLLSCSTAPKVDPLEAKAQKGDPVAACQLVARDLHACALEKQERENAGLEPPACLGASFSDQQESYIDKASAKLDGRGSAGLTLFAARHVVTRRRHSIADQPRRGGSRNHQQARPGVRRTRTVSGLAGN